MLQPLMEILTFAAYVLALPLIFMAAVAAFGWRFRRAIAESMRRSSTRADTVPTVAARVPTRAASLRIEAIKMPPAQATGDAAARAIRGADAIDRAADRCYLIAGSVFWAAVVALQVRTAAVGWPAQVLPVVGVLAALPGALVLTSIVARSWRAWAVAASAAALLTFASIAVLGWRIGDFGKATAGALPLAQIYALVGLGALLFLARRLRSLLIGLGTIAIFLIVGGAIIVKLLPNWSGEVDQLAAALGGSAPRWPAPVMLGIGVIVVPAGVWVFLRLLRSRSRWVYVSVLALIAIGGIVLDERLHPPIPLGPLLAAVPAVVLQCAIVWLLFKIFVALESARWLQSQTLQLHLCWSYLAVFSYSVLEVQFENFSMAAPQRTIVIMLFITAFAAYFVLTHLLLRRLRTGLSSIAPKRLLLLRVFNAARLRERLSDVLDDSWRRVGRIDLIGGSDLAMRTLRSVTLECFLLRRIDAEFLKSANDVDDRLAQLRSDLGGDLRFPVNEIYCYADSWQAVVLKLAAESDVVLLDFRGFARHNAGCEFELTRVVWHVPLARVLVLADTGTDMNALDNVAQTAWAALPPGSPNAGATAPRLSVVTLDSRAGVQAIVPMVFRTAFPA